MIKASITIDEFVDEIYDAILPETEKQNRSKVEINKTDTLSINIEADDATALRASMNSITQMLSVFYKIKEIK